MGAALTVTVHYDEADKAWVAVQDGEVLDRNHRIGPGEAFAAQQWLAWLIGADVPMDEGHRAALAKMKDLPTTIGPGLGSRHLLEVLHQNSPGHRTDEYEQRAAGLIWAIACTSLPDDQALARARSCPSGVSGGWAFSDKHEAICCTDWPDTHRHIVLIAG